VSGEYIYLVLTRKELHFIIFLWDVSSSTKYNEF